mgnify:FL=1
MKNLELRKAAKAAGIPLWRIADAIGVGEATITRKLRHELPENEKKQLLNLIKQLAREGENADEC